MIEPTLVIFPEHGSLNFPCCKKYIHLINPHCDTQPSWRGTQPRTQDLKSITRSNQSVVPLCRLPTSIQPKIDQVVASRGMNVAVHPVNSVVNNAVEP